MTKALPSVSSTALYSLRVTVSFWAAVLLWAGPLLAQVQYDYQGSPFTMADTPWALGDGVQGSFTVAAPLAPFLATTDISGQLVDFSFSDGVQTRTPANSTVCTFSVATDARGSVSRWIIVLREAPTPALGNDQLTLVSSGPSLNPGVKDQSDVGPSVGAACGTIIPSALAQSSAPGTWSSSVLPPPDQTIYTFDGAPFFTADAPWSVGGEVTGTLTFSAPLPPFLPLTDVSLAWDGFSLSDGVQNRNPGNTEICSMQMATDGTGKIIHWQFSLREFPTPLPGDPQLTLDLIGPLGSDPPDRAGTGPAGAFGCDTFSVAAGAASAVPGVWNGPGAPTIMPTRYDYSGNPFGLGTLIPPWSAGDRVTGHFIVQGPLPPNLPLTDISLALNFFSFMDGVQTRNSASTAICGFEVATDADGNLSDWRILLRESPFPPTDGLQNFMDLLGPTQGDEDLVGEGPAGGFVCDTIALSGAPTANPAGTWTSATLPTESIPTLTHLGLVLLTALLTLAGAHRLRRRI